jgi:hypothetical protein
MKSTRLGRPGQQLAILAAAALLLADGGSANAFEITQPIPGTKLTACLDVAGGSIAAKTPVESYECSGTFNQQWQWTPAGELQGIGTSKGRQTCLGSVKNVNEAILVDCEGQLTQNWITERGGATLDADGHGCLDSEARYGSGAQAEVNPSCSSAASQSWTLTDVVIEQAIPNQIVNACVDVRGAATANHTPVDAYPCTLGANERWRLTPSGQLQGIGTSAGVSTCLGVTASNTVELQTCNGSKTQQWEYYFGWVTSTVFPDQNGGCLDTKGNYGDTQLTVTPCADAMTSGSQIWSLE